MTLMLKDSWFKVADYVPAATLIKEAGVEKTLEQLPEFLDLNLDLAFEDDDQREAAKTLHDFLRAALAKCLALVGATKLLFEGVKANEAAITEAERKAMQAQAVLTWHEVYPEQSPETDTFAAVAKRVAKLEAAI